MDNNTNNIDTSVFGRLKRLFSNDVIIRNKGGKQLKTIDWNNIQAAGNVKTNSLVDRFTRLHRYGANMAASPTMNYQTLRIQLYNDYEAMEGEPIIASCLDIVADESTLKNEMGEVLQIRSSDENTQRILYNLFYDVLNIEFNLWTWVRNMCKYGDFYLHLEMAEKYGIYKAIPLSVYDITREEGYDEDNMDKVKFTMDPMSLGGGAFSQIYRSNTTKEGKIEFDNYEIAHFRLLSDANYLPYGRSFIEPARKVYKQYSLMKDAMLLHRIMRAPEKRVHYVQVGNLPPNEIDTFMQKLMQRSKKTPYIDQQTGEYNLKFNMQNMIEDYYIPQRGPNDGTRIETLPGLQYNAIEDVQFLRDEMLSALKVPKAFFGFEKDLQGKATLAAEDIRFARTIERVQRITLSILYKIAYTHLYIQGYDGEALSNFELSLTTPSVVYEQEKVALWKERVSLAKDMLDTNMFPTDLIYDHVFQFSEDQYDEYRDLVLEDKKRLFRLSQIENEGNDPAKTGKSYGTKHDLASLYGKGRMEDNSNTPLPKGYDEKTIEKVGRPVVNNSMINTQKDPLGKDRLGSKEMTAPSNGMDNDSDSAKFKTGSPLALSELAKYEKMLSKIPRNKDKKQIIFESDGKPPIFDEKNIRNI